MGKHPFELAADALETYAKKNPKYAHAALLSAEQLRKDALKVPAEHNVARS
jgi:hypothetical protein